MTWMMMRSLKPNRMTSSDNLLLVRHTVCKNGLLFDKEAVVLYHRRVVLGLNSGGYFRIAYRNRVIEPGYQPGFYDGEYAESRFYEYPCKDCVLQGGNV